MLIFLGKWKVPNRTRGFLLPSSPALINYSIVKVLIGKVFTHDVKGPRDGFALEKGTFERACVLISCVQPQEIGIVLPNDLEIRGEETKSSDVDQCPVRFENVDRSQLTMDVVRPYYCQRYFLTTQQGQKEEIKHHILLFI